MPPEQRFEQQSLFPEQDCPLAAHCASHKPPEQRFEQQSEACAQECPVPPHDWQMLPAHTLEQQSGSVLQADPFAPHSSVHVELHPSPLTRLPSSHSSVPPLTPLPHALTVQLLSQP